MIISVETSWLQQYQSKLPKSKVNNLCSTYCWNRLLGEENLPMNSPSPCSKQLTFNGTKMGPRKGSLSTADGKANGSQGTGRTWKPQLPAFLAQLVIWKEMLALLFLTNLIKHAKGALVVTADWCERANNLTTSLTEYNGAVETRTAKSLLKGWK